MKVLQKLGEALLLGLFFAAAAPLAGAGVGAVLGAIGGLWEVGKGLLGSSRVTFGAYVYGAIMLGAWLLALITPPLAGVVGAIRATSAAQSRACCLTLGILGGMACALPSGATLAALDELVGHSAAAGPFGLYGAGIVGAVLGGFVGWWHGERITLP